eukprot:1746773-Ditylum_brightwellii.AAC.1
MLGYLKQRAQDNQEAQNHTPARRQPPLILPLELQRVLRIQKRGEQGEEPILLDNSNNNKFIPFFRSIPHITCSIANSIISPVPFEIAHATSARTNSGKSERKHYILVLDITAIKHMPGLKNLFKNLCFFHPDYRGIVVLGAGAT